MIHMAIRTVTAQALERHVQITQELPATAPMMLDTQLMQRVMLTLLENASRFSPPYAQVVVRVQLDHAGASITVTDQGGGIAPALIPYIFEMCHHEALMSHNAAEGFSLAIARQIVLVHNGTLSVESTQGVGTTFTVWLPVVTPVGCS
jgi:two-component system sensor histidine kinase ResE